MPLQVGVIIEGRGEYGAVRKLLERVWHELLNGDHIDVLRPFRQPRGSLRKEQRLKAAVDAVKIKLGPETSEGPRKLVLILIDGEDECPRDLAPQLLKWAQEARSDADIACVLPYPMFETWFAAAASSLAGMNDLPADLTTPEDPEGKGLGKGWIKKQLARKYSEPVDQPRFAAKMDLALCRRHSPSFDKLCRELARRLPPPAQAEGNKAPTA
ncbi:MAG TPA: DUF4276 family protein [Gemmataceae bacterium]|jgi:hypothetical protein|nr:DUF4276 family protein [Gemmataceae bacterium]